MEKKKLLTVVTESHLEHRISDVLIAAGAKGLTITPARGQGPKNERFSDIEGGSIRIESVMAPDVLDHVLAVLERDYLPDYTLTLWVNDVEVMRPERY